MTWQILKYKKWYKNYKMGILGDVYLIPLSHWCFHIHQLYFLPFWSTSHPNLKQWRFIWTLSFKSMMKWMCKIIWYLAYCIWFQLTLNKVILYMMYPIWFNSTFINIDIYFKMYFYRTLNNYWTILFHELSISGIWNNLWKNLIKQKAKTKPIKYDKWLLNCFWFLSIRDILLILWWISANPCLPPLWGYV